VLALGTLPLKTLSCDGRLFNFAMANLGGLADGSNVGFIDYRRAGAANRLAGHVPFHLADTLHQLIQVLLIHDQYPSSAPAAP